MSPWLVRAAAFLALAGGMSGAARGSAPAWHEALMAPAGQQTPTDVVRSAGVRFVRVGQTVGGLPVLGAEAVLADGPGARRDLLVDRTRSGLTVRGRVRVGRAAAIAAARVVTGAGALRVPPRAELAIDPRGRDGWRVWRVLLAGRASLEAIVDAETGTVLRVRELMRTATGTARLFDPNPVTAQGDRAGLADDADADGALLTALRSRVELHDLTDEPDCLDGPWVRPELPSGPIACPPSLAFDAVTRSDDAFEALMVAFHVDRAHAHLAGLGFAGVMDRQVPVVVDEPGAGDNSWYDPLTGSLTFGDGGVDDAEDADVIAHEYAHAIQDDQVPGFGATAEGGAMGEGFGDYLAAALSAQGGGSHAFDACFAEWDVHPLGRDCLRRTDLPLTLSEARANPRCRLSVHCVGQVWSAALWEARAALGGARTDRTVIQSHFALTASGDFLEGARALLAADRQLYGGSGRDVLVGALVARGLLDPQRLDDTPPEAVAVPIPGTIGGTVDASSDPHDVFRLRLGAGRGVVVRTSTAAPVDVRLLRPGALAVDEPGTVVASTTAAAGNERLAHVADRDGDHYLDVAAVAGGAGAYALEVLPDGDGDTVPDAEDGCPAVPDREQLDWDRDGRGDACDASARAGLRRAFSRGDRLVASGRLRPSRLAPSAWHLLVERRVCRPACRLVRRWETAGAVRRADGRLSIALLHLPPGRYRVRAVVRARGYAPDRSPAAVVTIRRR